MEINYIKNRWLEYIEELFHEEREEMRPEVKIEDRRLIVADEIKWALSKMKRVKAAGEDGVFVEMLEAMGDFANQIYDTGAIAKRV